MRSTALAIFGVLGLAVGAPPGFATSLTMHASGVGIPAIAGGEGGGRGIGFQADSSFSIDSAGIFMDLVSQSYDVLIYGSTNGSDAGAVLASASAVVGGSGAQYYDIAIAYTFTAGSFYVLHWRPTDLGINDWVAANTPNGFFFDSDLPETIGPVTLLDGEEGSGPDDFGNFLHPNLRVDVVDTAVAAPEPFALALFGLGLVGLGLSRRR